MDPKQTSDKIQSQVAGYLSDFSGQSAPTSDVLSGKYRTSEVLASAMNTIHAGEANINTLGRAYKHAPHSPPAVLFKYIVHRVNNLDQYDSPTQAHKLDHHFMARIGLGEAYLQNHKVTPRHLNEWLATNPQLVESVLDNKAKLMESIPRSNLNVRKVNGQHYVAVARGLNSQYMTTEMPLASFADIPDTGFGNYQHHLWMPLDDLWYAFPMAPTATQGNHGHENEWLFSDKGQRYVAEYEDVKQSHFSSMCPVIPGSLVPAVVDDDLAAGLVEAGRLNEFQCVNLHVGGLLGPKTLAALVLKNGGTVPSKLLDHPSVPREEALKALLQTPPSSSEWWIQRDSSMERQIPLANPNLTPEDLKDFIHFRPTWPPDAPKPPSLGNELTVDEIGIIASHPSFNESVGDALVNQILNADQRYRNPRGGLAMIARNAKVPCLALHKALIGGLDQGEDAPFDVAATIADCFSGLSRLGLSLKGARNSQAFNNAKNTERYLRALGDFYQKHGSENLWGSPANVYRDMLGGARVDDTTVGVLVDFAKTGKTLSGINHGDFLRALHEMAYRNPHLTVGQMVKLAAVPTCAMAFLQRHDPLHSAVQNVIAENLDPMTNGGSSVLALFARKPWLAPSAADLLLNTLSQLKPWYGHHSATDIAANVRIPEEVIKEYLGVDNPELTDALKAGLELRPKIGTSIVQHLPPGGME